jgi:predicted metal-dependent phosphoesterase TrpH
MGGRADLHTHSTASDGTVDPAGVVAAAAAAGLAAVAVTDHDTLAGLPAAAAAARRLGIELVPGTELSCRTTDGISLHLLGYWPDPSDADLLTELALNRDDRVPRIRAMVRRLAADGYQVSFEELLEQTGAAGATLGRPHLARLLVAHGYATSLDDAFDRLLGPRSAYYVAHHGTDPVAAVRLVRAAGGVAVFAHPFAAARGPVVGDEVVAAMAEAGLSGLEVDHPDHDPAQRAHAARLATELGLLPLGSSDFHGANRPQPLGAATTPEEVLAQLRSLRAVGPGA